MIRDLSIINNRAIVVEYNELLSRRDINLEVLRSSNINESDLEILEVIIVSVIYETYRRHSNVSFLEYYDNYVADL